MQDIIDLISEEEKKLVVEKIIERLQSKLDNYGYVIVSKEEYEKIKNTKTIEAASATKKRGRKAKEVKVFGRTFKSIHHFAEAYGLKPKNVYNARHRGIDLEDLIPKHLREKQTTINEHLYAVDKHGNVITKQRNETPSISNQSVMF